MKKLKKIAVLYLLFGFVMGVYILINSSGMFMPEGISILTFIGFWYFFCLSAGCHTVFGLRDINIPNTMCSVTNQYF